MKKGKIYSWLKVIISFVLIVALFVTTYLVSFNLFKDKSVLAVAAENIAVSSADPTCYYMKKVSPQVAFEIKVNNAREPHAFTLTDSNDRKVKATIKDGEDKSSYIIQAPEGGYKNGEDYTLILTEETTFAMPALAEARKLVFTIESKEIAEYEFGDNVIEVDEPIVQNPSGTIRLPDAEEFENGDIIFGKNEADEYVAYKIINTNGSIATVEKPAVDEVYEELRIYQEFDWDVSGLQEKVDLENEVVTGVVSSEFYSDLLQEAYEGDEEMRKKLSTATDSAQLLAAQSLSVSDFEFEYEIDSDNNTVSFDLTIPIQPGKAGLFGIEQLKHHSIKLNLSNTLGCNAYMNFKSLKNWDLSYTIDSEFSWSIELEAISGEFTDDPDLDDLFYKTSDSFKNQKYIKRISDKLERFSKDHGDMEVDLFEWKIPVAAVPGVFLEAEVECVISFEMNACITVGNTYHTSYTAGIRLYKGEFDPYTYELSREDSPTLAIRGTAGFKFGVQLEAQLCFIDDDIAYIGITPQIGMYIDVYALAPITGSEEIKDQKSWYVYVEPGVYMQVEIDAFLNLLGENNDLYFGPLTFEKKWAIPPEGLGNSKISLSLEPSESTVISRDGMARIPQIIFEYYDAQSGLRKSDILRDGDYKLYDESGNEISVSNGQISLPGNIGEGGMVVVAKYQDKNDQELETEFVVTDNVSVVEGRVSAFNRGNSMAFSGAKVRLYKENDTNIAIASKVTEEDGEFHFNVAPGTYKLIISAQGYKTLYTTQVVGENETKYTEHLLLIDETMDGMGTASGTISDALNGSGIANATIKLRKEWNNASGEYVEDFSTTTNSSGRYSIEGLPIGYYTVEAIADGYIATYNNILVLDERDLVAFDFAMTPTLEAGKVRIILNWGSTPRDIDSHLIGRTPSGDGFNVYFGAQSYRYNGVEMANLDHDDTSSYGPETVTILENIHGTYTYAVHDYSNNGASASNALSYSGARVRVMIGGRDSVQEFYVPVNRIGTYWTVFTIDSNYNIVPINTVSNTKPLP